METELLLEDRLLHFIDWLQTTHGIELCTATTLKRAKFELAGQWLDTTEREAVVLDYVNC